MTSFPGSIHDASGNSLDPTLPDLLQEQLDDYPHRSMVTDRDPRWTCGRGCYRPSTCSPQPRTGQSMSYLGK